MGNPELRSRLASRGILALVVEICEQHHVEPEEIFGGARVHRCSFARMHVWYALRDLDPRKWSYPEIGRLFSRDHTTVIVGVQKFELAAGLASARPRGARKVA